MFWRHCFHFYHRVCISSLSSPSMHHLSFSSVYLLQDKHQHGKFLHKSSFLLCSYHILAVYEKYHTSFMLFVLRVENHQNGSYLYFTFNDFWLISANHKQVVLDCIELKNLTIKLESLNTSCALKSYNFEHKFRN